MELKSSLHKLVLNMPTLTEGFVDAMFQLQNLKTLYIAKPRKISP
jgi:hypothetical protein